MSSNIYIFCSDRPRNGKTLIARLFTDYLAIGGLESLKVFDTDYPDGALSSCYPDNSEIVDLSTTSGQIRLFDTMVGEPGRNYVVDLQANLLRRFFKIFRDTDFDKEISQLDSRVVVFFIVDRESSSLGKAAEVGAMLRESEFFIVENSALGSSLETLSPDTQKELLNATRKIVMPGISKALVALLQDPEFSLFDFMAGNLKNTPDELQLELWTVLDILYEQRSPDSKGTVHLI